MNVSDIVAPDFVHRDVDTPVSELSGLFEEPTLDGVVVSREGIYRGVVTRRDLLTSHHPPTEKVGSVARSVPTVTPTADVREVARLLVEGDTPLLPVVEEGGPAESPALADLAGVVTVRAVLELVEPYLDVLEVRHVDSEDLVTVTPAASVGEALHAFRTHHVTHLPVVEEGTDGSLAGILSVHDVLDLTTRAVDQPQGGSVGDASAGRATGGRGERRGERERMLDLPVRDVMTSPVGTTTGSTALSAAVGDMLARGASSLVVVADGPGEEPVGIVTTTDVLLALTWTAEGHRGVQVVGTAYLDDASYDDVVALVDDLDAKYGDMTVLDAKIHLHEHDESLRGTPLLLARVRLYTDRGHFIASGEGFGASAALNAAKDVLQRELRDAKTRERGGRHPDPERLRAAYGW
ncbi:MAG: CBS domain-containing protein [Haloarculaceae archaeon]